MAAFQVGRIDWWWGEIFPMPKRDRTLYLIGMITFSHQSRSDESFMQHTCQHKFLTSHSTISVSCVTTHLVSEFQWHFFPALISLQPSQLRKLFHRCITGVSLPLHNVVNKSMFLLMLQGEKRSQEFF